MTWTQAPPTTTEPSPSTKWEKTRCSPRRLKIPALLQPNAWWAKMRDAGNGWIQSPWFGTFQRFEQTEWIYHTQLGWIYAPAERRMASGCGWNRKTGYGQRKRYGLTCGPTRHPTGFTFTQENKQSFYDFSTSSSR